MSRASSTDGQARKFAHSGKIMLKIFSLSCSKYAVPYLDSSSAGLQSVGTHSIHARQRRTMHMACHAVVSVWISRDLLLPFVRAQHTL